MHFRIQSLVAFTFFLSACVSTFTVSDNYEAKMGHTTPAKRTVILFLIDGLAPEILSNQLEQNKLPELQKFFALEQNKFATARTVFPSLTYPSITSVLTAMPVFAHGLTGNKMRVGNDNDPDVVDFASPLSITKVNDLIKGKTLFARLTAQRRQSVSLAHYFYAGATSSIPLDLDSGIAYLDSNYTYVDTKILNFFEALLTENTPEQWPEFIFVHLTGVDFLAHELGPMASVTLDYMHILDNKLKAVFAHIRKAEMNGKRVVTLLTADHGFMTVKQQFDFTNYLNNTAPTVKTVVDTRFAELYFPKNWSGFERQTFLERLLKESPVDMSVQRLDNDLWLNGPSVQTKISYVGTRCPGTPYAVNFNGNVTCPEDCPSHPEIYGPFFVPNIASFFFADKHPDAVVIAKPGTILNTQNKGEHGGATAQEVFVPLLMRNATLSHPERTLPSYEILRFVDRTSEYPVKLGP